MNIFNQQKEVVRHHWVRQPGDIAIRYDAAELPGIIRKGLLVEPGTNAVLVVKGANQSTMPPGEYALENSFQRFGDWLTSGIPDRSTISLVDISPLDLEFSFGGCFTSDPLPIGLKLRLKIQITEPARFVFDGLKEQHLYNNLDLRTALTPEVYQEVDSWLRKHTLDQLVNETNRKDELELSVEEAIRRPLAELGIKFLQIRTVELNLEPYDEVNGLRAKTKLMIFRAEADAAYQDAETQARKRLAEINKQKNLEEMAAETLKVEIEEQRIDLYQRMRQAMSTEKMNEVRSEAQFEAFLQDQDRQKLLSSRERDELLRTWNEQGEDHNKARAHTLARLEVEQNFELRMLAIKLKGDMDRQNQDIEIELARKKANFDYDMKKMVVEQEVELEIKRQEIALAHERAVIDLENLKRQQERKEDEDDAMLGIRLLGQMKEIKAREKEIDRLDEEERLRIHRVHETEMGRMQVEIELKKWEIEERRIRLTQDFSLKSMEMMKGMGTEAIIANVSPEAADRIVKLKQVETEANLKSEVQNVKAEAQLAMQEKELQMMKDRLAEVKDQTRLDREENDKRVQEARQSAEQHSRTQQEMTNKALDAASQIARDVAQASHQNVTQNPPMIITPGMPQGTMAMGGAEPTQQHPVNEKKNCPVCGRPVAENARFCPFCGNKFEGVS